MSAEELDRLNELFARAVYTSGIEYVTMTESKEWEEFFHQVNPAYKMPDHQMLATTLLDSEYTRVENKVKEMLQEADTLCLQLDGWTNRKGEAIINVIVTTPTPVLYKTIETRLEEHNHENLTKLIEEVVQEIDNSKFGGIITNNASVMLKATSLVASKQPHIHSYSCAAHSFNLLLQDVMKINSAKELITACSDIVTKVNGNSLLRETFNKIQFEKSSKVINLKHHVKTRPLSWRNCMTSLLLTQNSLKLLWVDDECSHLLQDKQDLKSRILDDNFWLKVNDLNNFIKKTVEWIVILESNTSQISYVAECFLKLKNDMLAALPTTSVFSSNEKKSIKRLLDFREGKILHPIHFAANILDPNFRGKILSQAQEISAMEFIETKIGQVFHSVEDTVAVFGELAQYRCSHGFYAKEYVKKSAETIDPLTWWMGICSSSPISKVSQKILAMPATNTVIEHSFSTQSFIRSARKNRLTAQMVQKMKFIKCNLKLFQSVYDSRRLPMEVNENEQVEVDQGDREECDVDGEAENSNSGDEFRLFEAEELELERFVDEIEIDVDF